MNSGYDAGPIIESEDYIFPRSVDYQSIRIHVYREGCALAGKVLRKIQETNMSPCDATPQDEDHSRYWSPIPDEKMKIVLSKVNNGAYKYQCL